MTKVGQRDQDRVLRDPDEKVLFKEAFSEPNRIKDVYMPNSAPSYRSVDDEIKYMRGLFEESPLKLCRYMAYKIFHFIRAFHEISLLVFTMDFMENERGDWVAIDAKIFTVFTHRKELSKMPAKDDIIVTAETYLHRIQKMQDEINEKMAQESAAQQVAFLTQKALEDEDFNNKVLRSDADKS